MEWKLYLTQVLCKGNNNGRKAMLFSKLKLNYFGRFHDREIDLKPGINLVYGDNEAGKSTIHTFIKGMLFGIERLRGRGSASKEDVYTRYLPWDYPGAFSGSMDIGLGDKKYRLFRSFHANDKDFTVMELSTGRELKLKDGSISELIPGLTESTFKNTISIEQLKAQTDAELAAQVRNYIANLSIAKSKEVNVARAVSRLTEKRKALEATQVMAPLKALQSEIEEGLEKEERIDAFTLELRKLTEQEHKLKEQKEAVAAAVGGEEAKRSEQLPAILEKYRTYKDDTGQILRMDKQEQELTGKISEWEAERPVIDDLQEAIKEVEDLKSKLQEYEKEQEELKKEAEAAGRTAGKRNLLISLVPAILLVLVSLIFIKALPVKVIVALTGILAGILCCVVLDRFEKKNRVCYEDKRKKLEQRLSEANEKIKHILGNNRVNGTEELNAKRDRLIENAGALEHSRQQLNELKKRKEECEDKRDDEYDTIMNYVKYYISVEELSDDAIERLRQVIRQKKQEGASRLADADRLYNECRQNTEKLKWELSALEGNEALLLNNQKRYAELEQQRNADAVELEAVKLALDTIQSLSADIHDSFGRQLNAAVSEIISEVTDRKYTDIKVDEKLDVKVGWNGEYVLLDRLSAGTIDQVYFALRLAVADLLLGRDELPLLLDDSFALYDEKRVKSALLRINDRKQIILFSCHKREKDLLDELGMEYHYVDLSQG